MNLSVCHSSQPDSTKKCLICEWLSVRQSRFHVYKLLLFIPCFLNNVLVIMHDLSEEWKHRVSPLGEQIFFLKKEEAILKQESKIQIANAI